MNLSRLIVFTTVAFAAGFLLAEQYPAASREKVLWDKTANYNISVPARHKISVPARHKQTQTILAKKKSASVRHSAPSKWEKTKRTPRILQTFDYGESSLVVKPVSQTVALATPPPSRCEWARSIVAGYAFGNVQAKSCEGSIYVFEGTRDVRTFLIEISGIDGDLIKVEKVGNANTEAIEKVKTDSALLKIARVLSRIFGE